METFFRRKSSGSFRHTSPDRQSAGTIDEIDLVTAYPQLSDQVDTINEVNGTGQTGLEDAETI